ncbi:MAG: universal stress protein [Alphaproteobacteria bacterium]|nr:universal stress protein [Alphaproteobacteria bacterium]
MKQILLPFDAKTAEGAPIEAALTWSERFDGHVTAVFAPGPRQIVIADPMGGGTLESPDESTREAEAEQARRTLETRLDKMERSDAATRITIDTATVASSYLLGDSARLFDVTVLGKQGFDADWQALFEAALFEGGRTVMLVPEASDRFKADQDFGGKVAIAWNRSTETARLLGQTMDVIRQADEFHIIELEDWYAPGPDGEELKKYLQAHGVHALLHQEVRRGDGPGADIRRAVEYCGADLLLKGAYTQSRLRQFIFGGATRDIIQNSEIPVLFAH